MAPPPQWHWINLQGLPPLGALLFRDLTSSPVTCHLLREIVETTVSVSGGGSFLLR